MGKVRKNEEAALKALIAVYKRIASDLVGTVPDDARYIAAGHILEAYVNRRK